MSLWADAKIKELLAEVATLKERVSELETVRFDPEEEEPPLAAADLRAAYENKFGKPPHHRMKPETIQEALK
jgi:hypothetical protein